MVDLILQNENSNLYGFNNRQGYNSSSAHNGSVPSSSFASSTAQSYASASDPLTSRQDSSSSFSSQPRYSPTTGATVNPANNDSNLNNDNNLSNETDSSSQNPSQDTRTLDDSDSSWMFVDIDDVQRQSDSQPQSYSEAMEGTENFDICENSNDSNSQNFKPFNIEDLHSEDDVQNLSIRQIKLLLTRNFVDYKGCVEKQELLEKALRLWRDIHKAKQGVMLLHSTTIYCLLIDICSIVDI